MSGNSKKDPWVSAGVVLVLAAGVGYLVSKTFMVVRAARRVDDISDIVKDNLNNVSGDIVDMLREKNGLPPKSREKDMGIVVDMERGSDGIYTVK